ncbi:PH domain-containing protein [Actinoplanes sp. NPDC026623]|uniref:PH domain-containing protein n=1 Tax=Actinoplanes sp. NPDC026623 TaxID=3155610 RepID=UPI003411416D
MRNVSRKPVLRVRKSGALIVAALIALVGTLPFAGARWQLAPILLIPLAVLVWALRAGTDVDAEGLRIRALFGTTDIPWSRVAELAADDRRRVSALLTDGKVIRLTGVTPANLPAVIAASGRRLDDADGSVTVDDPVDERLTGGEPA